MVTEGTERKAARVHTVRTTPDVLVPLTEADRRGAAQVLAAALADDPGYRHLFPDPRRRELELQALYRMTLDDAINHGRAYITRIGSVVTGAIAIYPPHTYPMSTARWLRQGLRIARMATITREHSRGIARFGTLTSSGVPTDAWYVEALGVRPDLQRAGRGYRLIQQAFALADEAGERSYLETTKPENVAYYAEMGYEETGAQVSLAGDDGPWIVPMLRPAREAAAVRAA
ncbi:GNAT family N-acetyltransferase [Cellulomonas sp. SG140]|uniref:GNAT family N-acetyltransferase n=1 Tax=Cellulomonas sp. SG140 TaxID=2976536 RepID=UPI0021E78561|nr:GNAT family N-acetyltransferase [Cellulomonas sp. SG140]